MWGSPLNEYRSCKECLSSTSEHRAGGYLLLQVYCVCVPASGGGETSKGASSALCGENTREKKPQKCSGSAQIPGQSRAWLVLPPPQGTFHTGMLWEGGESHQVGGYLGPPQEILPEGRSQPTPHLFELAALAHHRPSMGSAAVSQTSSIHTAVTPTATSPGSLQDPRTGDNWVLPPWLQDWHYTCKRNLSVGQKNYMQNQQLQHWIWAGLCRNSAGPHHQILLVAETAPPLAFSDDFVMVIFPFYYLLYAWKIKLSQEYFQH